MKYYKNLLEEIFQYFEMIIFIKKSSIFTLYLMFRASLIKIVMFNKVLRQTKYLRQIILTNLFQNLIF